MCGEGGRKDVPPDDSPSFRLYGREQLVFLGLSVLAFSCRLPMIGVHMGRRRRHLPPSFVYGRFIPVDFTTSRLGTGSGSLST